MSLLFPNTGGSSDQGNKEIELSSFFPKIFALWLSMLIGSIALLPTASGIDITVPELTGRPGAYVTLPVNIGDTTGLRIIGVELTLTYNANILTATSVSIEDTVASSSGWGSPVYNIIDGQVIIWMAHHAELAGEGALLRVNFTVSQAASNGDNTPLALSDVYLNEGNVPATTNDGSFTVDNAPPETTTSLTCTPGENSWYISDVIVELFATDTLSDVKGIWYKINDGVWEAYSSSFMVTDSSIVYYYSEDNAGNIETEKSTEIRIDKTAPENPVVTDDGEYTTDGSQLHASWTSADTESGISEYKYAIGTIPGGNNIVDWTSAGTNTEATKTGMSLIDGQGYYFSVKAKNDAGLWSDVGVSNGITVDTTPPGRPVVVDVGDYVILTTQLHASWTTTDDESGIVEYQYAIGTTLEGTDVVGWTSTGTDTEVTATGLSLTDGQTYYFSVKARNGASLWSDIGVSDGVLVVSGIYGDVSGNGIISAYDAALILQYGVGLIDFTPQQQVLGDVSGDGTVSAYDAALILQYGVGLITEFPVESGAQPAPGIVSANMSDCSLELSGALFKPGTEFTIVVNLENADGVIGVNVALDYDQSVLVPVEVSISRSSDCLVKHGSKDGQLRISLAASGPIQDGDLAEIKFRISPDATVGVSSVSLSNVMLNETTIKTHQAVLFNIVPYQFALLQNYPNPFNPDTWIPYELAEDSEVSINIYNVFGRLVRRLDLGYRTRGVYYSRSEAAHWDGRNEAGECVTSGVYFYQIKAGSDSEVRKMVISR